MGSKFFCLFMLDLWFTWSRSSGELDLDLICLTLSLLVCLTTESRLETSCCSLACLTLTELATPELLLLLMLKPNDWDFWSFLFGPESKLTDRPDCKVQHHFLSVLHIKNFIHIYLFQISTIWLPVLLISRLIPRPPGPAEDLLPVWDLDPVVAFSPAQRWTRVISDK